MDIATRANDLLYSTKVLHTNIDVLRMASDLTQKRPTMATDSHTLTPTQPKMAKDSQTLTENFQGWCPCLCKGIYIVFVQYPI